MILFGKPKFHHDEFRWNKLATYNSEVSRGLLHTEEWKARMAKEQETFNEFQYGPDWRKRLGIDVATVGKSEVQK